MTTDYVSIKSLANELGMDRSLARKYVIKIGVKPHKRRTPDSSGQAALTVTTEEAEYIRNRRKDDGFTSDSIKVVSDIGVFYIIRLVPELDPNRIKMGFAEDINSRLSQHRTSAPTAQIVAFWPCKRSWEYTVMDCLSSYGCKLILNEVFECNDIDHLISVGNKLFEIIPSPKDKIELSDVSPLRTTTI